MMLLVTGVAGATIDRTAFEDEPWDADYDIAKPAELRLMQHVDCQEDFVEYMPDWDFVTGSAYMKFRFDEATEKDRKSVV